MRCHLAIYALLLGHFLQSITAIAAPVTRKVLDNGLTVLLQPADFPTVSVQIFVRAGSRNEILPGKTGLAHIFEHLMFRGTPTHPDYDAALLAYGAENNADTSEDRTRYFEVVHADHLQPILAVEADRFKHLKFTPQAFANELGPVRQEREKGYDNNPYGTLYEKLSELAYQVHTYRHDTIGTKEDIINMQFADADDFYRTFYTPKNIFIVVAGRFDAVKTLSWIENYFGGDWGRKGNPDYLQPPATEPPQLAPRRSTIIWKDATTPPLLAMAYHIPAFSLESGSDFCALEMTEKLLFLDSAPLQQRLVQKLKLVQPGGLSGGAARRLDPSLFVFQVSMRSKATIRQIERVEKEIRLELERLAAKPISTEKLEQVVQNYIASILYSQDTAGAVAQHLGELYMLTNNPTAPAALIHCYERLTPADIQNAVKRYLKPEQRSTVVLLPKPGSS